MKRFFSPSIFHLLYELTRREVIERYAGTSFGKMWLLFSPLVTIVIYTLVFSEFMQMKLGGSTNRYSYSIYLVAGLLPWTFFSNTLSRMTPSILTKAHIVKKINLPMYLYHITILLSESIYFFIAMVLGIAFTAMAGYSVSWPFLLLPIIIAALMIFTLSIGVVLSLLTPFFRDMVEIVPVILQLWFWITPIVYPKEMLLSKAPWLLRINPMEYFIEPIQNIFLYDRSPTSFQWFMMAFLSLSALAIALWFYKKTISTIKDML